jgi:hypothetical protein
MGELAAGNYVVLDERADTAAEILDVGEVLRDAVVQDQPPGFSAR